MGWRRWIGQTLTRAASHDAHVGGRAVRRQPLGTAVWLLPTGRTICHGAEQNVYVLVHGMLEPRENKRQR